MHHLRVVYSDVLCAKLWDMVFVSIDENVARNLVFDAGLPRRQTLLCDSHPAVVQEFIETFKLDCQARDAFADIDQAWARAGQQRDVFRKPSVKQLRRCLELDDWKATDRMAHVRD